MAFKSLQQKRQFVNGKYIIGIDPSKIKHQAAVLDTNGIQRDKAFTLQHRSSGLSPWPGEKAEANYPHPGW